MSYLYNFALEIIKNKDTNSVENGYLDYYYQESELDRSGIVDFLRSHFDFKSDPLFGSILLGNSINKTSDYILQAMDIDEDMIYQHINILLVYDNEIGLPKGMIEKLETYKILDDFSNNFEKVKNYDKYDDFDSGKIEDVVNNANYNVSDISQVKVLAELVNANFNDRARGLGNDANYSKMKLLNQMAINVDFDDVVIKAIEASTSGWYVEDIEDQLDKVDMVTYKKELEQEKRKDKQLNKLTKELLNKLEAEYKGILVFRFFIGYTGLEDQVNDKLIVEFDGKEVYADFGNDNPFGDTSLNAKPLLDFLNSSDFKTISDIFLF